MRYGLAGEITRELLSYGGKVLVHDNPDDLAFLIAGATPVALPSGFDPDDTMPLSAHPQLAAVRWPLNRRDFR